MIRWSVFDQSMIRFSIVDQSMIHWSLFYPSLIRRWSVWVMILDPLLATLLISVIFCSSVHSMDPTSSSNNKSSNNNTNINNNNNNSNNDIITNNCPSTCSCADITDISGVADIPDEFGSNNFSNTRFGFKQKLVCRNKRISNLTDLHLGDLSRKQQIIQA